MGPRLLLYSFFLPSHIVQVVEDGAGIQGKQARQARLIDHVGAALGEPQNALGDLLHLGDPDAEPVVVAAAGVVVPVGFSRGDLVLVHVSARAGRLYRAGSAGDLLQQLLRDQRLIVLFLLHGPVLS